jgi:cell wall-associated NlpC family hydrolase
VNRSILTGICVFALSASLFGRAAADETVAAAAPASSATASSAGPSSPAPAAPAADSDDAAQPTAGADLAMWNAEPAAAAPVVAPETVKHISRLRRFASGIVSRSSAIASSLTRSALRFIGTPYVFGGTRSTGFDCSGYVQHVFAMLGFHLPRTADAQFDAGHHIAAAMEPGDLVFFHTYAPGVSHVGIYLGNNRFIHSSSSRGVSISSLHDSYWAPRYRGAKRVFGS